MFNSLFSVCLAWIASPQIGRLFTVSWLVCCFFGLPCSVSTLVSFGWLGFLFFQRILTGTEGSMFDLAAFLTLFELWPLGLHHLYLQWTLLSFLTSRCHVVNFLSEVKHLLLKVESHTGYASVWVQVEEVTRSKCKYRVQIGSHMDQWSGINSHLDCCQNGFQLDNV